MAGAALAVTGVAVAIDGTTATVARVVGAPFDFTLAIAPAPVALRGVVVREHDPDRPVAGAQVRVDGGDPQLTDAGGRFSFAALPVAATVTLTASEGAQTVDVPFRPDHTRPVNTATLSLRDQRRPDHVETNHA